LLNAVCVLCVQKLRRSLAFPCLFTGAFAQYAAATLLCSVSLKISCTRGNTCYCRARLRRGGGIRRADKRAPKPAKAPPGARAAGDAKRADGDAADRPAKPRARGASGRAPQERGEAEGAGPADAARARGKRGGVPYKLMAVATMLARDGCEGSAAQALPPSAAAPGT